MNKEQNTFRKFAYGVLTGKDTTYREKAIFWLGMAVGTGTMGAISACVIGLTS